MATLAILVPVKVEKRVPAPTANKPNLPGRGPSHLSTILIKTGAIPEWNITSPMRMNKGMGRRIKEFVVVYMLITSCSRPILPPKKRYIPPTQMSRKQKAIGMPDNISINRQLMINMSTNCHSKDVHLLFL